MRKLAIASIIALAIAWFPVVTTAQEKSAKVFDIEGWSLILGSCEKVFLNDDFQSGVKRCYYLDPQQKYGVGAITWAFYKDGTEHLYWKGWMLHTDQAQTSHLLDGGTWYVTPPRKMPYEMGYLVAMRAFFEKVKGENGKLNLKKTTGYVVDENGNRLIDKTTTIYHNKNSANDPNPVSTDQDKSH